MSIDSVLKNAILRKTEKCVYKIETYSEECTLKIQKYIQDKGHRCAILGWAVITNFEFTDSDCLELLSHISTILDDVSETDLQHFLNCGE